MGKFLRSLRSFSRKKSVGIRSYEIVCKPGIFQTRLSFPSSFLLSLGDVICLSYIYGMSCWYYLVMIGS